MSSTFPISINKPVDALPFAALLHDHTITPGNASSKFHVITKDLAKTIANLNNFDGLKSVLCQTKSGISDYEDAVKCYWGSNVENLISSDKVGIFTTGRLGRQTETELKKMGKDVVCYIDNSPERIGSRINDIPVISPEEFDQKEVPVIIASTRFTATILNQLSDLDFLNPIPYSLLPLIWPDEFSTEIPYIDNHSDFFNNPQGYLDLMMELSDKRSQDVLDAIISYRLTHDPKFIEPINDGEHNQYHANDINPLGSDEVFVDVGGFDGDTVRRFLKNTKNQAKHIFLFEPDTGLIEKAKSCFEGRNNITYVNAGAYSFNGVINFEVTNTVNGSISESGSSQINVTKLDDVVTDTPTMIKMDIEGAEVEALKGASAIIKKNKPVLAIAVYHFGSQIIDVKNQIHKIRDDYKFYLRHYTETGLETVLYAV